ncbi:hypothetical protein JNB11_07335 [Kocuria palustris]|nr:hypothetical protein [Kocuria palustris]
MTSLSLKGNPKQGYSLEELDKRVYKIVSQARLRLADKPLINYCIICLEVLKREHKKFESRGYCDYQTFYQLYQVASLCASQILDPALSDIVSEINAHLVTNKPLYQAIKEFLLPEDPLVSRLKNLTTDHNAGYALEWRENLSPATVGSHLKSEKVLIIDYQSKAEYESGKIRFNEVIHINPEWVEFVSTHGNSLDKLNETLQLHLLSLQYQRWLNLHDYDFVVVYDKNFSLDLSTIDVKKPPFWKLFDLIMNEDRGLLKKFPAYIDGGLSAWVDHYGPQGCQTPTSQIIAPPPATLSRGSLNIEVPKKSPDTSSKVTPVHSNGSNNGDAKYHKSFGDYLASAKPAKPTRSPSLNRKASNGGSIFGGTSSVGYIVPSRPQASASAPSLKEASPVPSQQKPVTKPKYPMSLSAPTGITKDLPKRSSSSSSQTVATLQPKTLATTATKEPQLLDSFVTGLYNLGNLCYMNCMLQCLAATPQLTNFFFPNMGSSVTPSSMTYKEHINMDNKLGTKGILTNQFVKVLRLMFTKNGLLILPATFKEAMGLLLPNHQFASCDQQDCIEFLDFMLDRLHEDLNQPSITSLEERKRILELSPEEEKTRERLPIRLALTVEWERYLRLNFSVIVDYFQGQYLSQLRCLECGTTSTTYNSFLILSLPIPTRHNGSSIDKILVEKLFDEYTTTELLDDDNKWHCPHCKRATKSTKTIKLTRLPQVLIIHFKRFSINSNGYFNKLDTFVTYPVNEELDLTKYWTGKVGTALTEQQKLMTPEEEQTYLTDMPIRNQLPPFRYKLYGVANHYGSMSTGHYTSYVYKQSDRKSKKWCYFDDEKVTYNCRPDQVMNRNAYCLFYRRVK